MTEIPRDVFNLLNVVFPFKTYPLTLFLAIALGAHGYRKGSLNASGALTASLLGFACLASPLRLFGVAMLSFYFLGSRATKVKAHIKAKIEDDRDPLKASGNRNAAQVASNAFVGTMASISWRYLFAPRTATLTSWSSDTWCVIATEAPRQSRFLVLLGITFFSACMGDTFASELGLLSPTPPILITTFKQVRRGTNGGVSLLGTMQSLSGGMFIGIISVVTLWFENVACHSLSMGAWYWMIGLCGAAGVIGSAVDSLLGATLQQSVYSETRQKIVTHPQEGEKVTVISGYDILSNSQVNIIASITVSLTMAWLFS